MKRAGAALALIVIVGYLSQSSAQTCSGLCDCNDIACRSGRPGECCNWVDLPVSTDPDSETPLGFGEEEYPGADDLRTDPPCICVTFPSDVVQNRTFNYLVVDAEHEQNLVCVRQFPVEENGEQSCSTSGQVFYCQTIGIINNLNQSSFRVQVGCQGITDNGCGVASGLAFVKPELFSLENEDEFFCSNEQGNRRLPSSLATVGVTQAPGNVNPETVDTGGACSNTVVVFILSLFTCLSLMVAQLLV